MRVSDATFYNQNRRNLGMVRERAASAQEHASSGKRVLRPSDDPLASVLARRERTREMRAGSNVKAVDTALSGMQISDSALSQVGDILVRARELAVMSSNDTMNADNRAATALEIKQLHDQIISLGNTKGEGGRHVFAGFASDTAPFDNTGAYVTDGSVRQIEVAPGVRVDATIDPTEAFGIGKGTDVIQVLADLQTALENDDTTAIQTTLGGLESAGNQIATSRAKIGALMGGMDVAKAAAETTKNQAITRQTNFVGVNEIDAFTELSQAQNALSTAVQIASQLPLPSLVSR